MLIIKTPLPNFTKQTERKEEKREKEGEVGLQRYEQSKEDHAMQGKGNGGPLE